MATCYHGPCDIYHPTRENQINWEFFLQTTQALIGKEHISRWFLFWWHFTITDTVVGLSEAKCKARLMKTEDNEVVKNSMVNKIVEKLPTVSVSVVTHDTTSENIKQKVMEQQSDTNYRQNDKLFTNYRASQTSNSILAYTGNTQLEKEDMQEAARTRADVMLYKLEQSNQVPDSPNMFYVGDNMDNPYFTRVTLPSKYKYLLSHCHPVCDIGSIIKHGSHSAQNDGLGAQSREHYFVR